MTLMSQKRLAIAGFALALASLAAQGEAQPAPAGLCWKSLETGAAGQDAIAQSTLTSTRSGDVWISRSTDPNLVRWSNGRWFAPPMVARAGVGGLWVEAVAASPSGRIVIAAAENRDDGASVLHIGRLNSGAWEWLGEPLISRPEPFRHARRPSIAFAGEQPVVAWSEELDAELAGLFVVRWNGSSWTRLGVPPLGRDDTDSYLTPAVAVDAGQQIWLAWTGSGSRVRVAHWNNRDWQEVGRESLSEVASGQGPTLLRELSLAVDSKGAAWVLRHTYQYPEIALARWDGDTWTAVAPPSRPVGARAEVWSASLILQRDTPLVGWSQRDPTENHHLYVSAWASGNRWTSQLADLHLVEGVSNVSDVKLAAGDGPGFFVSWDEPGKDKRSTRMIQAYTCAPGETPALPPPSVVERDTWPTTVDEAARMIVAQLNDESKAVVRATAKDQLTEFYSTWGMGIRNRLGLWRGNEKLLESCGGRTQTNAEACSMIIIEAAWTLLQREP